MEISSSSSLMFMMSSFFSVIFIMGFLCSSIEAHKLYVGGKDGWVLNPTEDYNHWAHRNRFQVNDTLIFKYKKGSDSVLIVTKEDYEKCNVSNPIKSMNDGESTFIIDRSGPIFFVSGNQICCEKGQKMIIVVLSERHKRSGGSTSPQAAPSVPMVPSAPVASPPSPTSGHHDDDHHESAPAPAPSTSLAYSIGSSISSLFSIALVSGVVSVMLL